MTGRLNERLIDAPSGVLNDPNTMAVGTLSKAPDCDKESPLPQTLDRAS
jgi:hypothetical protein